MSSLAAGGFNENDGKSLFLIGKGELESPS